MLGFVQMKLPPLNKTSSLDERWVYFIYISVHKENREEFYETY
jgi:hypothetical protein